MKSKALTREDRKIQIVLEFEKLTRRYCTYDVAMTVNDVAKAITLEPSAKLRKIMAELVEDEVLLCEVEDMPGIAGFRRIYKPNPERFTCPPRPRNKEKRLIRINTHQKTLFAAFEGN